jgi:hypothetical protein
MKSFLIFLIEISELDNLSLGVLVIDRFVGVSIEN